jgi:hypothetical protein
MSACGIVTAKATPGSAAATKGVPLNINSTESAVARKACALWGRLAVGDFAIGCFTVEIGCFDMRRFSGGLMLVVAC